MSIKDIHRGIPTLRHDQRFARNGSLPSAGGIRAAVQGVNTAGAILRKVTLVRAEHTPSVTLGSLGSQDWWIGYMRTGEQCTGVIHHVGLGRLVYAIGSSDSRVSIAMVDIGSGITFATSEIHFGAEVQVMGGSNEVSPDNIAHAEVRVDNPADNTEYAFYMTAIEGARPVYWAIAEETLDRADSSGNVTSDPAPYEVGGDIYAQDIAEALQKATTIRKHNAGYLFSWTWEGGTPALGVNPRTSSATYGPISQTGASPPNAATGGFRVDLTNRGTLLRGVPITFAVRAYTASGSTNNVRLVDQAGNVLCTVSSFGTTVGWKTATATIATTITELFVEFRSDGTNIMELLALACVQYES